MGGNRKFKNSRNSEGKEILSSDNESDSEKSISEEISLNESELNQSTNTNSKSTEKGKSVLNKNDNASCLVTRSNRKYKKPVLPESILNKKQKFSHKTNEVNENFTINEQTVGKAQQISKKDNIEQNTTKVINRSTDQLDSNVDPLSDLSRIRNETVVTPVNFSGQAKDGQKEDGEISILDYEDDMFDETPKSKRKRKCPDSSHKKESKKQKKACTPSREVRNRQKQSQRSRSSSPEEDYRSNPAVQKIVKKMVSEQVSAELAEIKEQLRQVNSGMNNNNTQDRSRSGNTEKIVKSPSDATVYTPAVPRVDSSVRKVYTPTGLWIENTKQYNNQPVAFNKPTNKFTMNDINNAITDIRFNSGRHIDAPQSTSRPQPHEVTVTHQVKDEPAPPKSPQEEVRRITEEAILQAERFKAQIHTPTCKGIIFNNNPVHARYETNNLKYLRYLDSEDDEFFHTTCHIDETIRKKIERGDFVELEKLLQKKLHVEPQEKRLQLVNRDGESYFVPPVDRETKIDNIRKWESAFRVYITIYCNANPHRSGEILQYVDVIHRAARIFSWDNVARYDYVFRQLMAAKPHRSWAKTYTQMWNLTLNEPIKKFNDNSSSSQGNQNNSNKFT